MEMEAVFSFCLLLFPFFLCFCSRIKVLFPLTPNLVVSNTSDTNTKYLHQMMQLQAAAHTNKEHAAYCILRCTNILHYSVLLKIHSAFFISFQQNINFLHLLQVRVLSGSRSRPKLVFVNDDDELCED